MRVVYIDTLFILNGVVDYLLLLASARIAGEPLCRGRFFLGALVGGAYAVALFLPGLGFLYHPACRLSAAVLMVLTAFWNSRRLLRQVLIFLALSCAFGGGVLAVGLLTGRDPLTEGGVLYAAIDLKLVLLTAAGCYALLTALFQRWGRHSAARGELEPVTLWFQDRQITLMALRDTGNTLTDPLSGRPVLVAEGARLAPLLSVEREDMDDPAGAIERLNQCWPGRFRLLPYRAVGVNRGLLLAVRLDRSRLGEETERGTLVALSPNPVSDGGSYQVLAGVM